MGLVALKVPPGAEIVSRSYDVLEEDPLRDVADRSVGNFAEEFITFLIG